MIKALIIDDEPSAVNTLQLLLQRYVPEITLLKTANTATDAKQLINSFKPQLVFLDIQMPVTTGFELLKQLGEINFSLIFTTAHDKYAIQAIRFSALDYLLKPIDADELRAAIDRFFLQQKTNSIELYRNFLYNIQSEKKDFKLAISTSEETLFFLPADIIRLEGESNYTKFFFINRKPLLTSKTLKEYEEILSGHGFIRIHKSHIINAAHVAAISNEGVLSMQDKSAVEISRRRKEEVMGILKK